MNSVPITMSNSATDCIDEQVVSQGAGTGGPIYYYHRNQQYSVTAITTAAGAIAERYAYTAYGQPTILNASGAVISATTLSNRYTYTGREWDATLGLHHFRARWMSPVAGRFLTRDPIGFASGRELLYEYVSARALVAIDPSGLIDLSQYHPVNQLVSLAQLAGDQLNAVVQDIGGRLSSFMRSITVGPDCVQVEQRLTLLDQDFMGASLKVYALGRRRWCKEDCCETDRSSAGLSFRLKIPLKDLPGTNNGIYLVIGGSATGNYDWRKCGDSISESGFVLAQGYVGLRASFQLTPKSWDDWIKAEGFVEAGAYASFRWKLPGMQYMDGQAGGYIRARAEFSYWGSWWSTTAQYSHTWCLIGNCNGGGEINGD